MEGVTDGEGVKLDVGVIEGVGVTVFDGVILIDGVGVGVTDGHAHTPLLQTSLTISPVLNKCEGGLGDEFTI